MTAHALLRLFAWTCIAAIILLSLVAPALRPVTILPHNLEHAAIFAIAGCAAGLGYPDRPAMTCAAFVLFAGAIELAQIPVPGRHARLTDFVVDALAACAGIAAALLAARIRPRAAKSAS
jgi:VanZ family protein